MSGWRDRAACQGRDLSEATLEHVSTHGRTAIAREYCYGCPVIAECAADAVECRDSGIVRAGVWIAQNTSGAAKARRALRYIADGHIPLSLLVPST